MFALSFRIFGILLGLFFFFAFQNYTTKIISLFFILLFILDFLEKIFFNELIFTSKKIIKKSNFFIKNYFFIINYNKMEIAVSKGYFGGMLIFWEKNRKFKTIWHFTIDLFPVSNQEFLKIRKILVEKNVIQGDKNGWSY